MIHRAVAFRYAHALFRIDCASNHFETRFEDFRKVIQLLKDHPKLVKFLKTPQIPLNDKKKLLESSLKFDHIFMNFLFYLIENERLNELKHIAHEYKIMVNERLNIWEARLITAVPLTEESERILKEKLEQDFQKKISLNKKVDPALIGGAILVIGNEILDWSVSGRLKKFKENLIAMHV